MTTYTFNKTDNGYLGKAFEMAIKDALKRKNADRVSPCGSADFRYDHKNYEVKQNGSCLCYNGQGKYIKGSNRVIYATHISHSIIAETETTITVEIDLYDTQMFCLDRTMFVEFLDSIGCIKFNSSRGTANIQTVYNYKKDAYHGRKGKAIEAWAIDNEIDDDIIDKIFEGLEL